MASRAMGLALTAGGLSIANEALFAPIATHVAPWKTLNWRLVPATAFLALALGGLESLAPTLAVGFGMLTVVAVLIIPYGKAPSVIDNVNKIMGGR